MARIDKRKFFKNPWVITIGGTAIGTILASIILKTNLFIEAFKVIWKFFKLVWEFFTLKLTLPVGIFILIILFWTFIILIFIRSILGGKKDTLPSFLEYRKDKFDGIVWRWEYGFSDYDKKFNIDKLTPFCPKCDCNLRKDGYKSFSCPNCNFECIQYEKSIDDLEKLIIHRMRKIIQE